MQTPGRLCTGPGQTSAVRTSQVLPRPTDAFQQRVSVRLPMKLRTKTWTVVLAATVALLGSLLLIGGHVYRARFARLENDQAAAEASRALAILVRQRDDLARTTRDYAEWEDTAAYAAGQLPTYRATTFNGDTLRNLKVDLALVYDPAANPVGGARVLPGEPASVPAAPAGFAAFADDVSAVIADPGAEARTRGFKRFGAAIWLYACSPLTATEEAPGSHGALVLARQLDDAYLHELSGLMLHRVSLHETDDDPPPVSASGFTSMPGSDMKVARVGRDLLRARVPLQATDGTAIAMLHVDLDRPVHRQATQTGWLIVGLAVGTALLFGVIFSFLLGRFVVARLERLHASVQRVGQMGDLQVRVPAEGNDEIASLGAAINTMLDALERGRAERDEAQREREKLNEQLLQAQKMEAIGEFAGGIAHDFNNCLTSITGWLSLVRHDLPEDSEHREHIGFAIASAQHAAAVVNQLLVYSRQGKANLGPLSLRELLASSLQLLRSALPRTTELQFTTTGDDDVVLADSTQLQQVVVNLVKNAADAMERSGRITLSLDAVTLPDARCLAADDLPPGEYARITVQDEGPGIPPELRERVFEPFFSTKGAGRGTGLGLAVVRSVVLRHHGAVGLDSPPGTGATFRVYLPQYRFEEVLATPPAVETDGTCRVLVVDDDPGVLRIVAKVITRHGCEVVTATDGLDGWEKFMAAEQPFELVLTDLTMPRLGGLQLGERIFNSGRQVPVLLMTAYAATLDAAQLRRAGFAALVAKPLDLEQLKQTMSAARLGQ